MGREVAGELACVGAAVVPEREAVRHVREREDLLDAAVAVRRDDQDGARQRTRRGGGEAQHESWWNSPCVQWAMSS